MTEIYGLFDAADPEAPDRVYTSEAFARLFRTMMRDGIVHNVGAELAVGPTVPAAMSVSVGMGMALVQGRYLANDPDLTLAVEAADPSYARIDRVIVRADLVGRTVHCVVKKGTPATSPVAPTLTRTAETWELSLAQVVVGAGATSIVAGNITDERGNTSLCGVAAPVYVPSSQLEVTGAVNMQSNALTGLPVPSASTDAARRDMGGATLQNLGAPVNPNDAARKSYVDDKVAGFGISDITIDADKNWNGKSINNIGTLQNQTGNIGARSQFVDVPGDTVRKTFPGPGAIAWPSTVVVASVTIPPDYDAAHASAFRVKATCGANDVGNTVRTITVKCEGTSVGSASVGQCGGLVTIDTTASFGPGDTLTVEATHGGAFDGELSVSQVQICSARSTIIPARKVFVETTW